jgi:hypothetical protein
MPRVWESWLQTAARPASATEEAERDRTVARVQRAIANSAEINSTDVRVYVKGSYASNTNVRRDSDVDVAVEWTRWFYVSTIEATRGMTPEELYNPISVGPTPHEFRGQVARAMFATFGAAAVDATATRRSP